MTSTQARQTGLNLPNVTIGGLLNWHELMTRLRNEADVLFIPMSFDAVDRSNMELAFPSKLADCTAVGRAAVNGLWSGDSASSSFWFLRRQIKQMISAIVPTIGRLDSLNTLLESLATQTCRIDEVIVASADQETCDFIDNARWDAVGLVVRCIAVSPPNAVRQRMAAIEIARGEHLLMLDDDVVLEPDCVQHMLAHLETNDDVVAVTADFSNQTWPDPTRIWQLYLRRVLNLERAQWQGRVVGPLLRFGFNPVPPAPQLIEWLGSGSSLVRRSAFEKVGGFSDFFLHRCTINEDVDLGLKLRRSGRIMFCPDARMAHHHAPGGRVTKFLAAEDDLFNRYFILRRTLGQNFARAFGLVVLYFTVETLSQFLGCVRRLNFRGFVEPLSGRLRAFGRILIST